MHFLKHLVAITCVTTVATACGDDNAEQAPMSGAMDAGTMRRLPPTISDAGPAAGADTGPVQAVDAGHFCASEGAVDVRGVEVPLDHPASEPPIAEAITSCIDNDPPRKLPAPIAIRGCVAALGDPAAITREDLDALEVTVFLAEFQGERADPTFDPETWQDREPGAAMTVPFQLYKDVGTCPGGLQVEIGKFAAPGQSLSSSKPYIVRLRSTTRGGPWATVYHYGVEVAADTVTGRVIAECNSQVCEGPFSFVAAKQDSLKGLIQDSAATMVGDDDLEDGIGDGYALIEAADCAGRPMQNAVGGFSPQPKAGLYVEDGAVLPSKMTGPSGLYLGLGFDSSAETPSMVTGAVGITRHAMTCIEEFGGLQFPVHPDALSVMRTGRLWVLNY